jgi:hypothetical protein
LDTSAISALKKTETHGKTDGTGLRIKMDFFTERHRLSAKKNQKKSVPICKSVVSVLP